MQLGIDNLPQCLTEECPGARIGLLCHPASCASDGEHAIELLATNTNWRLTTLLSPEHGLDGTAQDMEGVATVRHLHTGLPIYSLYGDTIDSLRPTAEMLADIDVLVIDLQDIGTRYYTYIYTMAFCLSACAEVGKRVFVCDRPNPINGKSVEGPLVEPGFASFVGQLPLPVRHGMTIGELASYFNQEHDLGADVTIIPMQGWQRAWYWDATGLPWINPSPNMRSLAAALLYPGLCLLEATNVSEGRGTDTPFEVCGAPWIEGAALADTIMALQLPGIAIEPTRFTPAARKFAGMECGGLRLQITDRQAFPPYAFGLALLSALAQHEQFGWRTPAGNPPHQGLDAGPYEFNLQHPAIDLLTGSAQVRTSLAQGATWPTLADLAAPPPADFMTQREAYLRY